jgi:hypothetical protein
MDQVKHDRLQRLQLLIETYEHVLDRSETFEEPWCPEDHPTGHTPLGSDLAYLMVSIARGEPMEMSNRNSLWWLLVDAEHGLPETNRVWRFVEYRNDYPEIAGYEPPAWVVKAKDP